MLRVWKPFKSTPPAPTSCIMPLSTHLCMHKISKLCLCEGHVAMRDRKGLQSLKTEIVSQQSLVFYFAFFSTTVAAQIPSASQSIKYETYDMYTTSDIHYASYFCAPMIHIFHKWQVRTSIRLHENACSLTCLVLLSCGSFLMVWRMHRHLTRPCHINMCLQMWRHNHQWLGSACTYKHFSLCAIKRLVFLTCPRRSVKTDMFNELRFWWLAIKFSLFETDKWVFQSSRMEKYQ